jgi:hypothetical protein
LYLFTTGGAPNPVYVSDGRCASTGPLNCSFGALRKNQTLALIVAFQTPADGTGDFSVDFEWNTSGLGSGGGDNSHGDAFRKTGTTHLNPNTADFAGGFLIPGSSTTVENDQDIDATNPQASTLYAPKDGIGVSVGDGEVGVCPTGFSCFGQATSLVVGDGSTKYGIFKLVVKVDSSVIPQGKGAGNIGVVHIFDNGAVEDLPNCPTSGPITSPCKIVTALGSGPAMGFASLLTSTSGDDDDCHRRRHHHDDDCSPPPPPPAPSDVSITIWLAQNGLVKFH